MISGTLTGLLLIALSTPILAQADQPQALADPGQLLANLDLARQRLAFSEIRTSELLNDPLEVTGELRLRENQVLERETLTPFVETQTLSADSVEIRRPNGHRRRFSLDRAPELGALREVLIAVMSGDTGPLADAFDMTASGQPDAWSLELRPCSERIADRLEAMVMSGSDRRLDGLELVLTNGERIETRFHYDP